jgi:hypothetical protein
MNYEMAHNTLRGTLPLRETLDPSIANEKSSPAGNPFVAL